MCRKNTKSKNLVIAGTKKWKNNALIKWYNVLVRNANL